MIPRSIRHVAVALTAALALASPAAAQLSDNLGALSGDNAKGYLHPLQSALSGTLNSAIFQGASIPVAGVNITVGVRLMGLSFDDKDRLYSPTDPSGFTSTAPVQAPTVIGDTHAVAQPGVGGTTLYHPGGFDIDKFALAVPQATIGSVFGTRAVVRYISLDLGDTELGHFSLFGIGAQHSVSQYFKELPVSVAVGVFYQKFDIGDDLLKTNALHYGVTASKRFGLFEPYATVGLDQFEMKAKYTDKDTNETIKVDFDTQTDGHFTLGSQLLLPVVKIHGEVNFAAETGVAVGLSFGS